MKKFFIYLLIVGDIGVIGACAVLLIGHLKDPKRAVVHSLGAGSPARSAEPLASPKPQAPLKDNHLITLTPTKPAAFAPASFAKNVDFRYRNLGAKKVMIRGEFTGWKAEPMQKTPKGIWTYKARNLSTGEYAYIFFVDGKPVRDPAAKRTKRIGKNLVSALVVKPPASSAVR